MSAMPSIPSFCAVAPVNAYGCSCACRRVAFGLGLEPAVCVCQYCLNELELLMENPRTQPYSAVEIQMIRERQDREEREKMEADFKKLDAIAVPDDTDDIVVIDMPDTEDEEDIITITIDDDDEAEAPTVAPVVIAAKTCDACKRCIPVITGSIKKPYSSFKHDKFPLKKRASKKRLGASLRWCAYNGYNEESVLFNRVLRLQSQRLFKMENSKK